MVAWESHSIEMNIFTLLDKVVSGGGKSTGVGVRREARATCSSPDCRLDPGHIGSMSHCQSSGCAWKTLLAMQRMKYSYHHSGVVIKSGSVILRYNLLA